MGKSGRLRTGCNAIKRLENSKVGMNFNEEKRSQHFNNVYKSTYIKDRKEDDDQHTCSLSKWSGEFCASKKPAKGQLTEYMEDLDSKRVSSREWALRGLVRAFENHLLYDFVENKSITLSMKFTHLLKKGSLAEVLLACRALGLLILTDGCTRNAHEIMEYATPHLSQALKHKSEAVVALALRTISILTFVGSHDALETERSMKLIWDIINASLSSKAKIHPIVLASAVSSWSLLLSTIDGWRISSTYWKGAIHIFLHLSCMDDQTISTATGKAIGLILDTDKIYKFTTGDDTGCSDPDNSGASHIESSLKDKIQNQVKNHLIEPEKKEFNEVPAKLLKRFSRLKIATQSQKFQFAFLRDYLGDAYVKHMLENKLFHDIFYYVAPETTNNIPLEEKLHVNPYFSTTKERTQYRNKQRCAAKAKREGHFSVSVDVRV